MGVGRDDRPLFGGDGKRRKTRRLACQSLDIVGGGAAAAAHRAHAKLHKRREIIAKFVDRHVKDGLSALLARQTRVGLHHNGDGGRRKKPLGNAPKLTGAERAVGTDGIGAHTLKKRHHSLGRGSRHQLAVRAVRVGHDYGQVAVFLDRKECRLGFVAVVHGFHHNKVGAVLGTEAHRLGEDRHRVLEIKVAQGAQKLARGADVKGDEAGGITRRRVPRRARVVDGRRDDGFQLRVVKLQAVGTEGVGADHVTACLEICLVNGDNVLGVAEIPTLGKLARRKTARLQKRAHTAVEVDDVIL